jgi:Fe-S-cluster containining protein
MPRLRLAILGSSPCNLCYAACCKQNGPAYSVLLEPHEYSKFLPFAVDYPVHNGSFRAVEKVLPYKNQRCVFLGEDDLCTIYEDRPQSCRKFECIRGYQPAGAHSEFLQRNPRVVEVLRTL